MAFLSKLRVVAVSTVALAVCSSAGLVMSSVPAASEESTAPTTPNTPAASALEARDADVTSRDAARQPLQDELRTAVEQRTSSLTSTGDAISATEQAIQEQRAAEKAAAEKAAAEKAAAEKAAAEKAAAEKKAAEEKAKQEAAAPKPTDRKANRELGRQLAKSLYGWGDDEFAYYDKIIMRESLWDATADNPTSSAYGIPQALPGKKMASEGADWATNPATQIKWGLKYIKERYGSPAKAWAFKKANGWY